MFVPTCPSPRVTTLVNFPLSYVTTSVSPSSFQEIQIGRPSAHLATSATCFVFASERAGYSWGSFSPTVVSAETRFVGLSGRITPVSASSAFTSSKRASHSKSVINSARPL